MFYFKNYLKQVLIINRKNRKESTNSNISTGSIIWIKRERENYIFFFYCYKLCVYLFNLEEKKHWSKRAIREMEKEREIILCIVTKIQLKSMSFYVIEKTENI